MNHVTPLWRTQSFASLLSDGPASRTPEEERRRLWTMQA